MISTVSFVFISPFKQFESCIQDLKITNEEPQELWKDYGSDILAWLDGIVEDPENVDWNNEVCACETILKAYVEHSMNYPNELVSFETYWRNLMMDAIQDNIESFISE